MTRAPFPSSPLTGTNLMSGLNTRFKQLYDAASFPLTDVGGTANAVTATLVPALDGDGLIDGMTFTIQWAAANTGSMTLAVNGGSALPVLGFDGLALASGSVGANLVSTLTYWGGDFILTSPSLLMAASAGPGAYYWLYETSGSWVKPTGLADDLMVWVECIGGGGGGSNATFGGGGGGGDWNWARFRAGDLASSVTLTVGAGGAKGAAGGNTTFGTLLTAYGGGHGSFSGGTSNGAGGGGGGTNEAGSNASGTTGGAGGYLGGGAGADAGGAGANATSEHGGGGGGAGSASVGAAGGRSVRGGGGGGGAGSLPGAGGVSLFGGNGGAGGSAGQAPGGGGGGNAAGARGQIVVWI